MAIQVTRAGVALTVGIILLTAVVFGGLWYVGQRGEQARRDEAVNIAEQKLQDERDQQVAANNEQEKKEDEATKQQAGESQQGTNTANNQAGTNGANNAQSGETQQGGSDAAAPAEVPSELPVTGPTDTFAIVGAAALAFVGLSYVASRRALASQRS